MKRDVDWAYREFERRCSELIREVTEALKAPGSYDAYPNADVLLTNLHAWRFRAHYNDLYSPDRPNLGVSKSDLLFGRVDARVRDLEEFYVRQIYREAPPSSKSHRSDELCHHLRPLEASLVEAGIAILFRGKAWSYHSRVWVYFDCYLARESLKARFGLGPPIEEHVYRGTHDGAEAGFFCTEHEDAIMGYHPEVPMRASVFR